ncbi:MAG: DUF2330 domain-containing protein [Candidatus Brocadiia bacterium]
MRAVRVLASAVVILCFVSPVLWADGKFYYVREEVPPSIPYQRALILKEPGEETLLLQSRYEFSGDRKPQTMGWVVPVPSVPELASMPAHRATEVFRSLSFFLQPHVVQLSHFVFMIPVVLCVVWAIVKARQGKGILGPLVIGFLLAMLTISFTTSLGVARVGVTVLKSDDVGPYDVKVIKADKPATLVKWLQERGFGFEESDREAFQGYIDRGWCFVAAQIRNPEDEGKTALVSEGLVAPLIMRFKTEKVVYPLILTSLAESETEMLIYTLSDHKLVCDDRMELEVARDADRDLNSFLAFVGGGEITVEPESFFEGRGQGQQYLCKFKGTLSPKEMEKDLTFWQAKNDRERRKMIFRW